MALTAGLLTACPAVWAADSAKPWTFWYWMYGSVSQAGIKADLQAMKDAGLGGCYLMPIRGVAERPAQQPPMGEPDAQQLSDRFWELTDYAMQQADSLGLELGIHICDGFALAGGPWITPEESMQHVVWTDTIVSLEKPSSAIVLPQQAGGPGGYYRDIASFACRMTNEENLPAPAVCGTIQRNTSGIFRASQADSDSTLYIEYDYGRPITVRSITVVPSGNNLQSQRLLVQASGDGHLFTNVRQLVPPRQGWQNTDADYTYALPETTARYFRFCWTAAGTEPGSEDMDAAKWSPVLKLKDVLLSAEPCIDQYESKNGSVWRRPADTFGVGQTAVEVIRLTEEATLPPGRWRILRIGHASTGHTNATAGGARGLECDKFSAAAVEKQIDSWFGLFMKRPYSRVVKYMHVDSWECGSQNWSTTFANEFLQRRGYDLLPLLPALAGVPVEGADRVLHDVRQTIDELKNEIFFQTVAKKARQFGVGLSAESVAPTMMGDGMTHFKYTDIPMGEFWLNSPTHDKPNDMLDAISGAHVYGKKIVQAEGFTEVRGVWDETPASIKSLLDRNMALGMNRLFFHVFTHNPYTDLRPGMTLDGIGLFFQRDQTWFPEAKGLVDYVTRCQQFLQRGRPVVDIAVFTGEEMPRRALTPDRLVPLLPGLFGPERVASERKRMANEGCPMEESPVGVRHSAGILDLKDWINPLHGYKYDSMNPEALKRWLSFLIDPTDADMPNYRVLVVPQGIMVSPETLEKIDSLKLFGITVITEPYQERALPGLPPDAILPEGIDFTHRENGRSHCFFLTNQTDSIRHFQAKFRTDSNVTLLMDPLTGQSLTFHEERQGDYCCVDIVLQQYGSVIAMCGLLMTDAEPVPQEMLPFRPIGENLTWDVTFHENGEHVKTRQLFDWSQSDNERIRYYSGHARYTTTFTMKKQDMEHASWWLLLPGLNDVGHVWLNGVDLGIVWTAPYQVLADKALHKGKNTLEIEVVNTWHNALRGADLGKAPYDGIWTNAKYRTTGDRLLPAGLLETPLLVKQPHGAFKAFFDN